MAEDVDAAGPLVSADFSKGLQRERWRRSPAEMAVDLTGGRFKTPPHIQLLSRKLADIAHKGRGRLIVSMPPRHGKSELVSRFFPLWYLSQYPQRSFAVASYGAELAVGFGRWVRNAAREWGAQTGLELAPDSQAAERWQTSEGGLFRGVGVGGAFTGQGAHVIVVDDPVKDAAEAFSPTIRQRVWDWWISVATTRLEPGGSLIVVMTRWHDDDLAGRLLKDERGRWDELKLPALAKENDPLGRPVDAPLWPERYDQAELMERRARGDWEWFALYEQSPLTSTASSPVKDADVHHWDGKLPDGEVIISVDPSFKGLDPDLDKKSKKRSRVGIIVALIAGGRAYVIDHLCEFLDFDQTEETILLMKDKHPSVRKLYIEDAANGWALIGHLRTRLVGVQVHAVKPRESKLLRLHAVAGFFRSVQVLLPPLAWPWVPEFLRRLCTFPLVEYDDDIDALTQLLAEEWLPKEKDTEKTPAERQAEWDALFPE